MKKCVFLVDVQYGFISDETKHILPRLDSLICSKYFDFIIASKFINKPNSPYVNYLNWHELMDGNEINLYEPIDENADLIINKNIYTAVNNEVLYFLKSKNINEIYIAGIDTDCCVLKTAVDFFEIGIRPYVLEYYSASNGGENSHKSALTVLNRLIGHNSIIIGEIN